MNILNTMKNVNSEFDNPYFKIKTSFLKAYGLMEGLDRASQHTLRLGKHLAHLKHKFLSTSIFFYFTYQ